MNNLTKESNKKTSGIIKKIQQTLTLDATETAFVEWRTSYHYETKSSSRRGGYNRSRTSYFVFKNNQWHKAGTNPNDLRPDELTGRFFPSQEMEVFLIPIPEQFHNNNNNCSYSLINLKTKSEILLKNGMGFYFFGSRESALFLGKSGEVKELGKTDYSSPYITLDGRIPDWRVFFPVEIVQLKDLFTPYRKIILQDEVIIQDEMFQYSFDVRKSEFRIVKDLKLALIF
jgi:hypothetical protein